MARAAAEGTGQFRAHAVAGLAKDAGQRRLAHLDRLPPQVRPVQLQQVEGVEE